MDLKKKVIQDLKASKARLEYSYKKALKIKLKGDLNDEQLEVLESFSSRFARYSDLIVARYLRLLAQENDPAFRGSVMDVINIAEKFEWIDDANIWKRIRELRNVAAHQYEAEDYKKLYKELLKLTPHLLTFHPA